MPATDLPKELKDQLLRILDSLPSPEKERAIEVLREGHPGHARATDHSLPQMMLVTEQAQVLGTPEYMSTEPA